MMVILSIWQRNLSGYGSYHHGFFEPSLDPCCISLDTPLKAFKQPLLNSAHLYINNFMLTSEAKSVEGTSKLTVNIVFIIWSLNHFQDASQCPTYVMSKALWHFIHTCLIVYSRNISISQQVLKPRFGQILLILAENVYNGKNKIQLLFLK
jgi:hypothetical protein